MRRADNPDRLSLDQIWENVFFQLSKEITGSDISADYFIISETDNEYCIVRATNQAEKWHCMLDPGIARHYKKTTDKDNNYTKEYLKYISCICNGYIQYDPNARTEGNAKRNVNLRYEELLTYLVSENKRIIEREIEFLRSAIFRSCCIKLCYYDRIELNTIENRSKIKKDILEPYRARFMLRDVGELIKNYLTAFYMDIEDADPVELLAVTILIALAQVAVDNAEGRMIRNAGSILKLQKQLLKNIENYLTDESVGLPAVIDIPLYNTWRDKFVFVRDQVVHTYRYPEKGELVLALDEHYSVRTYEINEALAKLMDKFEIRKLRKKLSEEMDNFESFLEAIRNQREYMDKKESNAYETEKEGIRFLDQIAPRVLRLNMGDTKNGGI